MNVNVYHIFTDKILDFFFNVQLYTGFVHANKSIIIFFFFSPQDKYMKGEKSLPEISTWVN